MSTPSSSERYDRARRRVEEQRIKESVFLKVAKLILQEIVDSAACNEVMELLEEIELVDNSLAVIVEKSTDESMDSYLEPIIKQEMHSETLRIAEEKCECSVKISALQEELTAFHSKINGLLLQLKQ